MKIGSTLKKAFKLPVIQPKTPAPRPMVNPPIDWNAVVDTHLWRTGNEPDETRKQGVFHPSAGLHPSCNNCQRQIMFDLVCAKRSASQIPTNVLKVLENGKNRHVGLQSYFTHMAKVGHMGIRSFEAEPEVNDPDFPIHGHADGLVVMDVGRYVLDFKTISPTNAKTCYRPDQRYIIQLNTYLGAMRETTGYVIYEDRGSLKWLGPMNPNFRVDFSPKTYEETLSYCKDILKRTFSMELPVFSEEVCKANVMFCNYQRVCAEQRENEQSLMEFDNRTEEMIASHAKAVQ